MRQRGWRVGFPPVPGTKQITLSSDNLYYKLRVINCIRALRNESRRRGVQVSVRDRQAASVRDEGPTQTIMPRKESGCFMYKV